MWSWRVGAAVVAVLGGCVSPVAGGEAAATTGAETATTTEGGTTEPASAATGWLALGQGEAGFRGLARGDELELVLGGQGAWMFAIAARGGGFPLPADPSDLRAAPRLDLWIDVEGVAGPSDGHLAQVVDLPLVFTVGEDGAYAAPYVPLIVPEVLADLRELDGRAGRLAATLTTSAGRIAAAVDVVIRAPVPVGGDGGGEVGGEGAPPDPEEVPPPVFVDVTAEAGLAYVQGPYNLAPSCKLGYGNNPTGDLCQTERTIAGAAIGDVDADGDPDLYVTRLDAANLLFINDGGVFSERGAEFGVDLVAPSSGAAWLDVDEDGDLDLYVTTVGDTRYYLLINEGGKFEEEGLARGAALESMYLHAGTTPTPGDYDLDGFLDLYVAEWRNGTVIYLEAGHARLLRNRGALGPGVFEDMTEAAGVSMALVDNTLGPQVFGPALVDLDVDGWPDLALAADFYSTRLFWNAGDGTFVDGTMAAGVAGINNGMGATFADFDGDGRLDWFMTAIHVPDDKRDGNRLYLYKGDRTFVDATDAAGVRAGSWGWGAAAFDVDNDGDVDLAQTGGWAAPMFDQDRLRLWRDDGAWPLTEVAHASGIDDAGESGRALAVWDHDGDGDLDLLVTHYAGAPILYRNDGGDANDWLRVRAVGEASNSMGIGARVSVRVTPDAAPQVREIGAATHFMGQSEAVAHFGLGRGAAPVAEVRVEWPVTGAVQVFKDVPRRSSLTAHEP